MEKESEIQCQKVLVWHVCEIFWVIFQKKNAWKSCKENWTIFETGQRKKQGQYLVIHTRMPLEGVHHHCWHRCQDLRLPDHMQFRTLVKGATTIISCVKIEDDLLLQHRKPCVSVSTLSISKASQQWKGADCRQIKITGVERHRMLIVTGKRSLQVSYDLQMCCYTHFSVRLWPHP